ncbi:MAG: hypothetical protein KGV50_06870 [Gammaproteobacteria bacterium]|nr:hypothetical protein [Gammaproteobacteria bacterium]
MKKFPNQQDTIRERTKINVALFVVFCILLTWVVVLFYDEINRKNASINQITSVTEVRIQRASDIIVLSKENEQWSVSEPYQEKASSTVVEAFLQRLNVDCMPVDEGQLTRDLEYYATVTTNSSKYLVGELNTATDRVYVKKTSLSGGDAKLALCDKLAASIALAPAVNFVDKALYQGELTELRGDFGSITDFSGLDFSVLELAPANVEQARDARVSELTFMSNKGEFTYIVLPPTKDGKNLLLFDIRKSLIYVIAAHPKINAIIGL